MFWLMKLNKWRGRDLKGLKRHFSLQVDLKRELCQRESDSNCEPADRVCVDPWSVRSYTLMASSHRHCLSQQSRMSVCVLAWELLYATQVYVIVCVCVFAPLGWYLLYQQGLWAAWWSDSPIMENSIGRRFSLVLHVEREWRMCVRVCACVCVCD